MRKTISFTISLSFILLFSYCKNEKRKQLDERKFKIESITNQAKAIFSKSSTDIDGYRLGMNKDSIQIALFQCLADSAELGLVLAEKIRDEVSLKVDSVKILDKLNAGKEQKAQEKVDKLAVKSLKSKVKKLFSSLISFKNKNDFRECGFGVGCKYNYWLREIQSLKSAEGADLFLSECGFVIGDLEMLGMEYVSSKGKETEYSRYTCKMIRDGLRGIKNYE